MNLISESIFGESQVGNYQRLSNIWKMWKKNNKNWWSQIFDRNYKEHLIFNTQEICGRVISKVKLFVSILYYHFTLTGRHSFPAFFSYSYWCSEDSANHQFQKWNQMKVWKSMARGNVSRWEIVGTSGAVASRDKWSGLMDLSYTAVVWQDTH